MLRFFFLLSFLFGLTTIHAQTITITGQVKDIYGHPVSNPRCFFVNKPAEKGTTDKEGYFSIKYQVGSNDTLKFEHVAFDDYGIFITRKMERRAKNSGKIELEIIMPEKMVDVVVVKSNVPDTIFGTQEYSVADFEFDKSGAVVLLTYEKNLSKGSVLRLLDDSREVIDSYYVQGEAVELRTDFRGNTHLITEEQVFLVEVRNNHLYVYLENRDYYFRYVAPLIDTISDYIYFSNYSDVYPAFDYKEFNRADSASKIMLEVEDELMMELYRSEFKYVDVRTQIWAHEKQLETGIDKEIWVGATVFTNSVYYEPLYAPLFKVGDDSVFVFDHYKDLMFKYVPEVGFTDSTRITYHRESRKSGWEQPLVQDRQNDKIYGLFLRNGFTYLSEINTKNGTIKRSFKLHYKYVERIRIIGDYVYYVYRPFESVQKKYIYREKLKS